MNQTQEIFNTIKSNGMRGVTIGDVADRLPGVDRKTIGARLSSFLSGRFLTKTGKRNGSTVYTPTGKEYIPTRQKKAKSGLLQGELFPSPPPLMKGRKTSRKVRKAWVNNMAVLAKSHTDVVEVSLRIKLPFGVSSSPAMESTIRGIVSRAVADNSDEIFSALIAGTPPKVEFEII